LSIDPVARFVAVRAGNKKGGPQAAETNIKSGIQWIYSGKKNDEEG